MLSALQSDEFSVLQHTEGSENGANGLQQNVAVVEIGIVVAGVAVHIGVILLAIASCAPHFLKRRHFHD